MPFCTQQIIATETGVTKTVDPLAGSYYIEYLTEQIVNGVNTYLDKIEKMGGSLAAIESNFFQEEIRKNAYELKKEIDQNKRVIVGVNKFRDSKDVEPKLNVIDHQLEMKQINKLKEFKRSRDSIKVQHSISDLISSAEKQDVNLMPFIISAVKSRVTLGEISNGLKEIFGSYSPKNSF